MASKALAALGQTIAFYPKCEFQSDCLDFFVAEKIENGCCAVLSIDSGIKEKDIVQVKAENKLSWIVDYV